MLKIVIRRRLKNKYSEENLSSSLISTLKKIKAVVIVERCSSRRVTNCISSQSAQVAKACIR